MKARDRGATFGEAWMRKKFDRAMSSTGIQLSEWQVRYLISWLRWRRVQ